MRKVPPGIQIIPSVGGAPTATSALNVLAGKSVVISRAASRSMAKSQGARYARALSQGYWTVVQHRSDPANDTATNLPALRAWIASRRHWPLFLSGGKIPVDSTHKSLNSRSRYAPKSLLRLQAVRGRLRGL